MIAPCTFSFAAVPFPFRLPFAADSAVFYLLTSGTRSARYLGYSVQIGSGHLLVEMKARELKKVQMGTSKVESQEVRTALTASHGIPGGPPKYWGKMGPRGECGTRSKRSGHPLLLVRLVCDCHLRESREFFPRRRSKSQIAWALPSLIPNVTSTKWCSTTGFEGGSLVPDLAGKATSLSLDEVESGRQGQGLAVERDG